MDNHPCPDCGMPGYSSPANCPNCRIVNNPLQFVRDGVPCEDQEAARREFIERYGVPIGKEFIRKEIDRALSKPLDNEPAPDISWEEYGRRLAEAVVKLKAEPVEPVLMDDAFRRPFAFCHAGHKLNSVGKCSCDVTPLGLSAKVVRDALAEVSKASQHKNLSLFWHELAVFAPDDELLKLWRLLR